MKKILLLYVLIVFASVVYAYNELDSTKYTQQKVYNPQNTNSSTGTISTNNISVKYPIMPIITNWNIDYPINNPVTSNQELRLRNIYDYAVKYYKSGQYINAQREINKVLQYYPNSPRMLMLKSQIEDGIGNNAAAIEYANKTLNLVQDEPLYLWRAYLMLKSGDTSKINLIYKDLDNINTYTTNIFSYGNETTWAWQDDKNIPSTMKADIYKYYIKRMNQSFATTISVIIAASYIQFIYGLDNNDPLLKKLGKTKAQILSAYLNALKGGKSSPFINGIMKIASGNTRTGQKEIISAFSQLSKYDSDLKTLIDMVGSSLRIIRPMPRKIDSYSIGAKIKTDETLSSVIISEILNPELIQKGIRQGDKITKINGKSISLIGDINDVGEYMRGEKDTVVRLEIPRIPGEITIHRNYHIQNQVYDYFLLPKNINLKDETITIGPCKNNPSGMFMYNPNNNRHYDYCM